MGILQKLIDRKAQTLSIGTKAPTADDKDGITDEVWVFLCPSAFSTITKADIENALEAAFPLVNANALLDKLKTADRYKKGSKADFEKPFKEILTDPDLKTVKAPKALNKIRPGGLIGGGVHGPGSIGGFLTNAKSEIFLFGDAHVMVKTINVAITSTTPQVQLTNGIVKNDVEIGVVVCSGSVRVGGQENYDLALAKIKSTCLTESLAC